MPFSHSGDAKDTVPPCHKAFSAIQESLSHTSEKPLSHYEKARSASPESPLRKSATYNALSHRHLHISPETHVFQPKTFTRHEKRSHPDVQFNTCRIIITPTRTRTPALTSSPFPILTLPPPHPPTFSFTFLPFYLFTSTKPSPLLTFPHPNPLVLLFILFNHPTI